MARDERRPGAFSALRRPSGGLRVRRGTGALRDACVENWMLEDQISRLAAGCAADSRSAPISGHAWDSEALSWRNWRAGALCFSSLLLKALCYEVFVAAAHAKLDQNKTVVAAAHRSRTSAAASAPFAQPVTPQSKQGCRTILFQLIVHVFAKHTILLSSASKYCQTPKPPFACTLSMPLHSRPWSNVLRSVMRKEKAFWKVKHAKKRRNSIELNPSKQIKKPSDPGNCTKWL